MGRNSRSDSLKSFRSPPSTWLVRRSWSRCLCQLSRLTTDALGAMDEGQQHGPGDGNPPRRKTSRVFHAIGRSSTQEAMMEVGGPEGQGLAQPQPSSRLVAVAVLLSRVAALHDGRQETHGRQERLRLSSRSTLRPPWKGTQESVRLPRKVASPTGWTWRRDGATKLPR